MKRLFALLFLTVVSVSTYATDGIEKLDRRTIKDMSTDQREARVEVLENRIREIESIDREDLSKEERKALRHEVKDIQKEMKTHASGGVYLSVGAIIIILLLLILLL